VIADEAVFSSTLGKLNLSGQLRQFLSYLQKLTEPTLPMFPSSPRTGLFLGAALAPSLLSGLITEVANA